MREELRRAYSLAIHGAPLESIAAELGVSVAVAENLLDEAWEVVKSQARAQREPVGTTEATAVAVRSVARGLRLLGFRGRAPTMARDVADGGVQLVNIQRANSGITGREPGFTLNLNAVPGALRRAWEAVGHRNATRVRRDAYSGISSRIGSIAFGEDFWWHPRDEDDANAAADEVLRAVGGPGMAWLDRWCDPSVTADAYAVDPHSFGALVSAAAVLVERPGDARRAEVAAALLPHRVEPPSEVRPELRQWMAEQARLADWLIQSLR